MAEGAGNGVVAVEPGDEERALRELAASREVAAPVTRLIDSYVTDLGETPEAASASAREHAVDPAERGSDEVAWWELSNLVERAPERAQALWQTMKDEAADELATGVRAARSLERPVAGRPYERARFLALVGALRAALAPRDPLEDLLVQQMAAAYDVHLRWQAIAVQRMETEAWQGERDKRRALERMSPAQRERHRQDDGWLPPRLAEAAATEQAAMMADRYQRSFLRLMKALRDNRKLFGALIVAGGQVNIADGPQQVNVGADPTSGNV